MATTFSPLEPLAAGTLLVEASAGTGKTYSITSLYLRLVAERGLTVDSILVVTFTRAAAAELRSRIRNRLVDALEAAQRMLAGADQRPSDEVLAHVLGTWVGGAWTALAESPLKERVKRLRAAVVDFDAAPVHTIHGFCQDALRVFGFEGGLGMDLEFLEDPRPLLEELVDDSLSRSFCEQGGAALPDRNELVGLLGRMTANPEMKVLPERVVSAEEWSTALLNAKSHWQGGGRDRLEKEIGDAFRAGYFVSQRTWGLTQTGSLYAPTVTRMEALEAALEDGDPGGLARCDALTKGPATFAAVPGTPFPSQVLPALMELAALAADRVDAEVARFMSWGREEYRLRKQTRRVQTFDDLLLQLRDAVRGAGENAPLVQGLRQRYRAALIDEFQDTDPVQWEIFRTLFRTEGHPLVLVGDPKQAIYSFRGADVFVYRAAAAETPENRQRTMTVNHRSDGRLLRGLNTLWAGRGAVFEVEGIDYIPVQHAETRKPWDGLGQPAQTPPVVVRWFDRDVLGLKPAKGPVTRTDHHLPPLVAADVEHLLSSGLMITDLGKTARTVRPRDVAVLTRTNQQCQQVRDALAARGIVAVVSVQESVFVSDQAAWIRQWLEAVASQGGERSLRVLALSPLVGWGARQLREVLDQEPATWAQLMTRVALAATHLERQGFARAFDLFLEDQEVNARLARRMDGERALTNLRHLAEMLHVRQKETAAGAAQLAAWLRTRADAAGERAEVEEAQRVRLESDEDAVLITTVHKSKGLEYPITFLPYLWNGTLLRGSDKKVLRFHERAEGVRRAVVDARVMSKDWAPQRKENQHAAEQETLQENLRLLYVALTRAKHRTVVYWGPVKDWGKSPLGILLHGGDGADSSVPRSQWAAALDENQDKGEVKTVVDALVARSVDATGVPALGWDDTSLRKRLEEHARHGATPSQGAAVTLSSLHFQGDSATSPWSRASYTSMTSGRPHGATPAEQDGQDHDVHLVDSVPVPMATAAEELPLARFQGGKSTGIFVHQVMENLDFPSGTDVRDSAVTLAQLVEASGRRTGFLDAAQQDLLTRALPRILATPLGPRAGNVALKDITTRNRLSELAFDLAIRNGARWKRGQPVMPGEELAARLGTARPDSDWSAEYLEGLRSGALPLPDLAGFLTGSMDLVYRAHQDGQERWFVADYKTNWIGSTGTPSLSTREHYGRASLVKEMARHHYLVQSYLYLVALHRYLRQRVRNYEYNTHVGGAVYLFVRGMDGGPPLAGQAEPPGVFVDRPPREVVEGLDQLFAGGEP